MQVDNLSKKWNMTEQTLIQMGTTQPKPAQGVQSKDLLSLNQKLSKQLEQNVNLLDDLNSELVQKEKEIKEQQIIISTKNSEVRDLTGQLGLMQSKVHSLAEMTKSALDTQEKVHSEHIMDL